MSREIVLAILVLFVCGPLVTAAGLCPAASLDRTGSGRGLERALWARLWTPLIPAAGLLAILLGWAFQEPEHCDESFRAGVLLAVCPFATVWMRALWRAAWAALLSSAHGHPAATIGLFRPRVFIDRALAETLDRDELRATYEHEAAHVRHRDPLKIWLARLATDLQGPWPMARARLGAWLWAVEVARDEEAREHGANGPALASAIITVAQLSARRPVAVAALTGSGEALKERVARLLAPVVRPAPRSTIWKWVPLVVAVVAIAVAVGVTDGETVVRALPGVVTLR